MERRSFLKTLATLVVVSPVIGAGRLVPIPASYGYASLQTFFMHRRAACSLQVYGATPGADSCRLDYKRECTYTYTGTEADEASLAAAKECLIKDLLSGGVRLITAPPREPRSVKHNYVRIELPDSIVFMGYGDTLEGADVGAAHTHQANG